MKPPSSRSSLSTRLLWLTAGVVMLAELIVLQKFVLWNPMRQSGFATLILDGPALLEAVHSFFWKIIATSLLCAAGAGLVVYFTLLGLLVLPIRRLIDSIAEFRADPERGAPLDPENISLFADDEMAVAGRELSALQRELRVALSRNARLSELGAAVAKVSHDLRNILSGALLAADRLATNPDPQTARAGEVLTHSVERANELIRQTLEFTREGPPPLTRSLFALRDLVDEAIEGAAPMGFAARNNVDADLTVEADYEKLLRVLENLLRNAGEAGARTVRIGAQITKKRVSIRVEDDGPGLAEELRANLFRPFVSGRRGGTGLGLAIARELMRAHGGDIELVETGPSGTAFRLILFARLRPNSGGDRVHSSGKRAL